ncbi:MAG: aldehyde ferredoxin oxidoreductase N-terminal domain-containing protein [Candidatus Helarchaeota archaeon]
MAWFGFAGQYAHINLSTGKIQIYPLPENYIPTFLGGYGINNRLFWDYQPVHADPFSPKNTIIIGTGPLVGTLLPGAGKVIGTTKSPIFASSKRDYFIDNAVVGSRRFGVMLKNAGFDHLVITGKAESPVYLQIEDDHIRIESAETLWGHKDIYETADYFLRQNPLYGIIAIGKGGEIRIRYALALVDYSGHLGKFGFGAVMGSKNLKAIITYGTKGIAVAEPTKYLQFVREFRQLIRNAPLLKRFQDMGITSGWDLQAPLVYEGTLPYRTWKKRFGPKIWKKYKFQHNLACTGCMLACRTDYQIPAGIYQQVTTFTGHHFLPARIALRLGLEDPTYAIKLLDDCNRAGICYFTFGGLLNWLTSHLPDEYPRTFSTYLHLLNQLLSRNDIGDVLAEGWYPLAEKLELDPDAFSKGTGLFKGADSIQDARTTTLDPQRFTYLTNPRPHHGGTQSIYTLPKIALKTLQADISHWGLSSEEQKRLFTPTPYYGPFNVGRYAKHAEDCMAVHNSLGTCIVYTLFGIDIIHIDKLATLYSASTGISITPRELKLAGERVFNLYKLLNIREGWRSRDILSKIWLTPRDTPDGPKYLMDYYQQRQLTSSDVEHLLTDYYHERGWDRNSIPTPSKLQALKLLKFIPNKSD